MLKLRHVAAAAAALLVSAAASAVLAAPAGKPSSAKGPLAIPVAGPDADARGTIDWKFFPANGDRAERSWLRLRLGRLDGTAYTVWIDDPATPETDLVDATWALTAHGRGNLNDRLDTKAAETLPFGATLATLAGQAIEIRDVNGVAVLAGSIPAPKAPHAHGHP
jgi:hypothetical protein